jgi:predicted glutamine amidotransferase
MSETIHTISTDAATLNEIADAVEADAPDPLGYRKATVILTLRAIARERAAMVQALQDALLTGADFVRVTYEDVRVKPDVKAEKASDHA